MESKGFREKYRRWSSDVKKREHVDVLDAEEHIPGFFESIPPENPAVDDSDDEDGMSEEQADDEDGWVDDDDDDDDNAVFDQVTSNRPLLQSEWDATDLLADKHCVHRHGNRDQHKRAAAAIIDAARAQDDFVFQHTETTYVIDPTSHKPVIRLWGITPEGNSVLVEDRTFSPYFYVNVPDHDEATRISERLESEFRRKFPANKPRGQVPGGKFVQCIDAVQGRSIMGWHRNAPPRTMFRFTMAQPGLVATARDWIESVNHMVVDRHYATFEANVPFELRYMIDHKINGCQWIRVRGGHYNVIHDARRRVSRAQYELHATYPDAVAPIPTSERDDIAPMRYLSYDSEVYRKEAGFPKAAEDPMVMICAALYVAGKGTVDRVCFATAPPGTSYGAIEGASVYRYDTEAEMLMAWRQYVLECDPEGFTGWNTNNFDMPYAAERAEILKCFDAFMDFSRILNQPTKIRAQTFQSKAHGARVNNEILCAGRFDFDGLTFMKRGVMKKFRSYRLNAIAQVILNDQKAEVSYDQIHMLYDSLDDEDRTRLLYYCLKDTTLVLDLLDKQMAIINGIEQARVTGVPIKWLMSRGQGVKTFSNLLRYKQPDEYVPSRTPKANTEVTGGGHVEEPMRGFYTTPTITLDFASLYPSIMIAHNICYSTKVPLAWARANLNPDDYWVPYPSVDAKTPEEMAAERGRKRSKAERERAEAEEAVAGKEPNFCFVKRHIRQGVLPLMLETLLGARRNVKGMMKRVDKLAEALKYAVLDGRQMALKVVCNSVYGFLKAFILVDKDLMAAVTSYGRNMLRIVKNVNQELFQNATVVDVEACLQLGVDPEVAPADGEYDERIYREAAGVVVYGDTDSVMINFGALNWADAVRLGNELSKACTTRFEKPNNLEFEAIKVRGMWLNKKRYAALQIEDFRGITTMAQAVEKAFVLVKGLESARRDNAPIGSNTQKVAIEMLLRTADIDAMESYIKGVISELLQNRVDMSQLVITKGLTKTEEQYARGGTKQQHVELRNRMSKRARRTGEVVPETGDRVPFVMVRGAKNSKAFERSENPVYAQKNGLPLDTDYYIHKQIWPAVIRVLTCYHEPERCVEVSGSMSVKRRKTLIGHQRIFSESAPHMRTRVKPHMRGTTGMLGFSQKAITCMGCKKLMRGAAAARGAVCAHCNQDTVLKRLQQKQQQAEQRRQDAWDICRKCQGGNFERVTCSNMTCNNFFHRDSTIMDLEDIGRDLNEFHARKNQTVNL